MTRPRKRTPLRIVLGAILLGFIGTALLFGGTSQATTPSLECTGKGCIECNPSVEQCVPPTSPAPTPTPSTPDPTPTPAPSTPAPDPTPTPEPTPSTPDPTPDPTPTPAPSTPAPDPTPDPTPTLAPEPSAPSTPTPNVTPTPESKPETSVLAKTGTSSASYFWAALILGAFGWGVWNWSKQKRYA